MDKIFEGFILASDMDGTLIGSNRKVSDKNLEAIKYFTDRGGMFTVATGRMLQSVEEFISDLHIKCPTMLHNGAKIFDFSNGKTYVEHFIEEQRKEAIRKAYEIIPNIGIEIFANEVVYVYRSCKFTERYKRHNFNVVYEMPDNIWKEDWTKVLLIGEKEELDAAERLYKEKLDKGNAFRSGSNYFDIVANGITKGRALKELVETLNIDPSKVIAVGDNMNDIEMIKEAKYGFCVKNGLDEVKEVADYIAPSNDEDAIAYIVNWLENKIK